MDKERFNAHANRLRDDLRKFHMEVSPELAKQGAYRQLCLISHSFAELDKAIEEVRDHLVPIERESRSGVV